MAASKRFKNNLASASASARLALAPGIQSTDPALIKPLSQALARLPESIESVAVGVSGGADSAMLAVHAASAVGALARSRRLNLHVFHIHHGLQPVSSQWQAHVHDLALALRLPCHSRCVQVGETAKTGIEAAARDARYAAFQRLAAQTGVQAIMLAHHRNDQAETVLLRLLRGAGPTGLAAMAPEMTRDRLLFLRPWLDVARECILAAADRYAASTGWAPVNDPTNRDDDYTRAAVRNRLAPELDTRWPGWRGTLVRHARLSAQTRDVLDEVAAHDLSGLDCDADDFSFSLAAWRLLSPARQALVLRYWLARQGLLMPSQARLDDMMRQLRGLHALGHDRHMRVKHGAVWVCCRKGRVCVDGAHGQG
jgi:tRNA(Ile)-lysidine synthase